MSAPPLRTAISDTYPNPSNATARTGFGALYDYVTSFALGQCRLVKSGANLVLQRYNGLWITINGVVCSIPAAGVSLAASGLTPSTLYYIYAYMSGATMTLEASTTGHSTDTATGVEIKTGDVTRTLVGMARPITGPAWQDSIAQRFVVSWFNPRPLGLTAVFTANRSYSAATYGEPNAEIRNEFLCWSTTAVVSQITGAAVHSAANVSVWTTVGIDGGVQDGAGNFQQATIGNATPVSAYFEGFISEGYHYATLLSLNTGAAGTVSYLGSASAGQRCTLQTTIQG
jgi:hypothetical protein